MKALLKKFGKDEGGATAIEYGLIAALISVAVIGTVRTLGTTINDNFSELSSELSDTGS